DLRSAQPTCIWREPYQREGPEFRAALKSVAAEVFEELGNMDQTPVQYQMPVETTLEKRGAKDARISTGGIEKERFTLCLAVMADGGKVHLRILFKGK
ncbi:unnamed protein product, partial [Ectocarpus sp. 4 AP-2014]